jgi:hypothetical protein
VPRAPKVGRELERAGAYECSQGKEPARNEGTLPKKALAESLPVSRLGWHTSRSAQGELAQGELVRLVSQAGGGGRHMFLVCCCQGDGSGCGMCV